MIERPKVVCLVGPTACHKTESSVQLAKRLNGEIVSADSVAVYRQLNIGSAKPTLEERQGVLHHMIDVADVWDTDYSVSRFRSEARTAVDGILARGKLPIVVGGSGLYSDAIFADFSFSVPSDPDLRARLEREYAACPEAVFERLRSADPVAAARLHIRDAKRVVRALEVCILSGRPFSEQNNRFAKVQEGEGTYDVFRIGLTMDRERLYQRIGQRVDSMFRQGLRDEAYDLFSRGWVPERYPAMQSIGYAQLYEAYCDRCSPEEASAAIKLATRHFAKRQLTWFRRNPKTEWYCCDNYKNTEELISSLEGAITEKNE